ncbi:SRPBCC family protein [Paenibacillus oryzisoli]|uniref:SRPBCC family protein n=1 Tax=Paenibacillus oryzisoli TaxID=1850517 RepID=UPI003D2BA5F0
MARVVEEIIVKAPMAVCFDAARDITYHGQTVWPWTKERAVDGRVRGLIENGETVTFEARHFGIRQRLTAKVTSMNKPASFVDAMTKGAFRYLTHTHEFEEAAEGTLMRDILDFSSPYGWVGLAFDKLVLKRYMRAFIRYRQRTLKRVIEQQEEGRTS